MRMTGGEEKRERKKRKKEREKERERKRKRERDRERERESKMRERLENVWWERSDEVRAEEGSGVGLWHSKPGPVQRPACGGLRVGQSRARGVAIPLNPAVRVRRRVGGAVLPERRP